MSRSINTSRDFSKSKRSIRNQVQDGEKEKHRGSMGRRRELLYSNEALSHANVTDRWWQVVFRTCCPVTAPQHSFVLYELSRLLVGFPSPSNGFLRLILPCLVEELLHYSQLSWFVPRHTTFDSFASCSDETLLHVAFCAYVRWIGNVKVVCADYTVTIQW